MRRAGGSPGIDCATAREALSASLDGEQAAHSPVVVSAHLAGCAGCRNWQEAAHRLTRTARLAPVRAMADDTERILEAVLADRTVKVRRLPRGNQLVRAGLAAAALAQLVIIIPALVLGNAGIGVPLHASRELGAFNLALAVGFAAAALRPALARGMLPLVGAATVGLVVLAMIDTMAGETTVLAEVPHLIAVAGLVLLYLAGGPLPALRYRRG
ncbi:MAG TPA: zf-HC2 domain-containing protein [Amycolatopsis sp.]|jgi:predicted anti-sigma-YlaC factor YlaD|nr:zf-HC2 domain-containing protein [Amycolatopsis sp.]